MALKLAAYTRPSEPRAFKGPTSRRARSSVKKPPGVTPGRTGSGADLGGSSEYSNESFEG